MRHPVQKRHQKVDPRPQHRPQSAKPLHHMLFRLRHDPHAQENTNDDEHSDRKENRILTKELLNIHSPTLSKPAAIFMPATKAQHKSGVDR